jgi:hypothetical protein
LWLPVEVEHLVLVALMVDMAVLALVDFVLELVLQ